MLPGLAAKVAAKRAAQAGGLTAAVREMVQDAAASLPSGTHAQPTLSHQPGVQECLSHQPGVQEMLPGLAAKVAAKREAQAGGLTAAVREMVQKAEDDRQLRQMAKRQKKAAAKAVTHQPCVQVRSSCRDSEPVGCSRQASALRMLAHHPLDRMPSGCLLCHTAE